MNIYDFSVRANAGDIISLETYRGKVAVIVNVASHCGFTPQYEELQRLYDQYRESGLVILGFPCNQFAWQEPGTDSEIVQACRLNYWVTFPIFSKIEVNGPHADPLYSYLKGRKGGWVTSAIKWNFTKFLIDQKGNIVHRYAPSTSPKRMESDIKKLLFPS